MIQSDPPEHDKQRRQAMRHFGPPHTPDLIPSMETPIQKLADELLDKAKGKTRIDVVDNYAYPLPVMVICQILGVPLKDEPHSMLWIHDFMAGVMDMGPETATKEGKERGEKGKRKLGSPRAIHGRLDRRRTRKARASSMLSKMVHDDGPDGRYDPQRGCDQCNALTGRRS